MSNDQVASQSQTEGFETANDRFKRSFGNWFWGSMMAATVLHFMLFQFWRRCRPRTSRSRWTR